MCPLLTRRYLVPRGWGPCVRPTQLPLLEGSPSCDPGRDGGGPSVQGGPRRLTGIPSSVGPECYPGQSRWRLPRVVEGPLAPTGHAPPKHGGPRGVSGGLCGCIGPHKPWGETPVETPSPRRAPRGPARGENQRGGAERRQGRRRGAPANVQGPISARQLGATEGGTGLPHATGIHHTPAPSFYYCPTLTYSHSLPRVKTRTRWPCTPRGRRGRHRRRRRRPQIQGASRGGKRRRLPVLGASRCRRAGGRPGRIATSRRRGSAPAAGRRRRSRPSRAARRRRQLGPAGHPRVRARRSQGAPRRPPLGRGGRPRRLLVRRRAPPSQSRSFGSGPREGSPSVAPG